MRLILKIYCVIFLIPLCVLGQTQSGCTVTFPNNFNSNVNISDIYDPALCPSGDLVLDNLNTSGTSTVTFDANITLNSLALNYKAGASPLEIVIPSGVTVTVTNDLDMNLTSTVQAKFLTVEGGLSVGGNFDMGNIDLEIDGSGTIGAGSITGGGNASCEGSGTCPIFDVTEGCDPPDSGICTETALPIVLGGFYAVVEERSVRLEWSSFTETNNDYYTLLKSKDGLNYATIGQVDGAGSSSQIRNYVYVDRSPSYGRSYYRLQQTDFDGTTVTFNPTAVDFTNLVNGELTFSNPVRAGEIVTIYTQTSSDEKLNLEIYDIRGLRVLSTTINGGVYKLPMDASMRFGIYLVKVSSSTRQQSGRLVVQ